jgi:isopenicillin-N N-acyltransferase-like protein
MMKNRLRLSLLALLIATLAFNLMSMAASARLSTPGPGFSAAERRAAADPPPFSLPQVKGSLTYVKKIPVLKLWGTPQEQGFAYGQLAGRKIIAAFTGFLESNDLGVDKSEYENTIIPGLGRMLIEPAYEEELRAMLAGIQAATDGNIFIPSLKRDLRYEDLVAINCLNDIIRMGCSSVAAWGKMTSDGSPLIGRNNDWHRIPPAIENQLVVARIPPAESGKLAFVSVAWAGIIGCITGMNEKGIVLTAHDASGLAPSLRTGFYPYMLTFRDVIESTSPGTTIKNVEDILKSRVSGIGKNLMITIPTGSDGPAAVVFELDGDLTRGHGFAKRFPSVSESYFICTNHFRIRKKPSGTCERYTLLLERLKSIDPNTAANKVTTDRIWDFLKLVVIPGWRTHHSVVFEPDKKLMRVALAEPEKDAPFCQVVTFDVSDLLNLKK